MGLFGWGDKAKSAGQGVEAAGKGIESAGKGVGTVLSGIRNLFTGDLPPETVEALKNLEVELVKVQQEIQKGQQGIEIAAINKGGMNAFFIASWRPALGWISALAIFSYYVPPIMLQTFFWVRQSLMASELIAFPHNFDIGEIMGLVASLLGMSTLRTIEKSQGVQDRH